jgi:hypothetical protein
MGRVQQLWLKLTLFRFESNLIFFRFWFVTIVLYEVCFSSNAQTHIIRKTHSTVQYSTVYGINLYDTHLTVFGKFSDPFPDLFVHPGVTDFGHRLSVPDSTILGFLVGHSGDQDFVGGFVSVSLSANTTATARSIRFDGIGIGIGIGIGATRWKGYRWYNSRGWHNGGGHSTRMRRSRGGGPTRNGRLLLLLMLRRNHCSSTWRHSLLLRRRSLLLLLVLLLILLLLLLLVLLMLMQLILLLLLLRRQLCGLRLPRVVLLLLLLRRRLLGRRPCPTGNARIVDIVRHDEYLFSNSDAV